MEKSYALPQSLSPESARAVEEYLIQCGKEIQSEKDTPVIKEINGGQYVFFRGSMQKVRPNEPERDHYAECFKTFSLSGLVDYITSDVDGIFKDESRKHIVRITDPTTVQVFSPVTGYYKDRVLVASVEALAPDIPFGRYLDPEDFQIMVQTRFKESDNRAIVLKLAGNVRKDQSMQKADDGTSQKITVQQGVATSSDVVVKNPVILTPLRTFYEVEQPESPFILRFNEDANVALFSGDGGAWKLQAVANIKAWLTVKLAGRNVEIIA